MATLALTNLEIKSEVGRLLGISRTPGSWDSVTEADVDRIIRSGRRRFFSAARWKFLVQNQEITLPAAISTGTVTIVSGVVTLVGATWPATVANYRFEPEGGGAYLIASRDSDTEITLNDTTVDADALSTYELHQVLHDLPTAFGGWEGPITLENYNGNQLNESRNFPEFVIRAFGNRLTVRTGRPELFSVVSTTDSETAVASHQLSIYPFVDKLYSLNTRYRISAGDTLDLADSAAISDPTFSECYKESILAAAEVIAFGQPGAHAARFAELLVEAVRHDNAMAGIRYGRPRQLSGRRSQYHNLITATVDMSGQE